jgi:hypothetical protein
MIMKPSRYAVETFRTGTRTEHKSELDAIRYLERLRKKNIAAWIINIYD